MYNTIDTNIWIESEADLIQCTELYPPYLHVGIEIDEVSQVSYTDNLQFARKTLQTQTLHQRKF